MTGGLNSGNLLKRQRHETSNNQVDAISKGGFLTKGDQMHAMGLAYRGQVMGIILFMLFTRSAFGTLFIKHLGGSDSSTMYVLAIPGLLPFVQIPLSLLVHPANGRRFLLGGWACFGFLMGLIALVPWMFGHTHIALWITLLALGGAFVVNLAASTFWFPLLHDIVPADIRGRFFGKLRATWSILLFFVVFGIGLFLGESPATWQFQVVILIGVALVFVRHFHIARVPLQTRPKAIQDDYQDWKQYLKNIWDNRALKTFFIYFALLGCSAGFLGHPLVLYMRDLGFAPRDNIIIFGFTTLGAVVALFAGGYAVDRLGTRRVVIAVHVLIVAMLVLIASLPYFPAQAVRPLLAVAFAISGATIAVGNLALTTHLFHSAPERGRVFFLSLINVLMFLGPSVATLITGIVLSQLGSTRVVHLFGASLNLYQIMLALAGIGALLAAPLLKGISNAQSAK